jgi:hypothetical protein
VSGPCGQRRRAAAGALASCYLQQGWQLAQPQLSHCSTQGGLSRHSSAARVLDACQVGVLGAAATMPPAEPRAALARRSLRQTTSNATFPYHQCITNQTGPYKLVASTGSGSVSFQIQGAMCDLRTYCCATLNRDLYKFELALGERAMPSWRPAMATKALRPKPWALPRQHYTALHLQPLCSLLPP